MGPACHELARWIGERFAVTAPFYIEHEFIKLSARPRLQVVFERQKDIESFYDPIGNYDAAKQNATAKKFRELLIIHRDDATDLEGLFAIFSAFEPVAREEANSHAAKLAAEIQRQIACADIWTISSTFDCVAVFFKSDEQLHASEGMPIRQRCQDIWMEHLLPHDEFGYFAKRPIEMRFESQERLNRDFEGKLFYYWR